jgi:hypothetical protein
MLVSSWVAAQLAASQEGLGSMSESLMTFFLSYRNDRTFRKSVIVYSWTHLRFLLLFSFTEILSHSNFLENFDDAMVVPLILNCVPRITEYRLWCEHPTSVAFRIALYAKRSRCGARNRTGSRCKPGKQPTRSGRLSLFTASFLLIDWLALRPCRGTLKHP